MFLLFQSKAITVLILFQTIFLIIPQKIRMIILIFFFKNILIDFLIPTQGMAALTLYIKKLLFLEKIKIKIKN